ncbi:MAG: peptide-methionine (S)-S-oxide reductase MsrA [Bacteroidales bacterium]|nr:peptide-methionine (S)-S-oxide reductase MsrA [Bacteroidales bacterium]
MKTLGIVLGLLFVTVLSNVSFSQTTQKMDKSKLELATFGAGCFWCVEAVFQQLKGVELVVPGYSGGTTNNPTYKEVCTGLSGHAEVAQISYDPEVISYDELLEVFWKTHDPTTLNRQGADKGTQYRSVIFYHNKEQQQKAESYKDRLNKEKVFDAKIVTEISEIMEFFEAENYHNDYFVNNPEQSYCKFVIQPKVEKFKKVFPDKIKKAN